MAPETWTVTRVGVWQEQPATVSLTAEFGFLIESEEALAYLRTCLLQPEETARAVLVGDGLVAYAVFAGGSDVAIARITAAKHV